MIVMMMMIQRDHNDATIDFVLQLQGSHDHGRWCRGERRELQVQVWLNLQLRQLHLLPQLKMLL